MDLFIRILAILALLGTGVSVHYKNYGVAVVSFGAFLMCLAMGIR